MRRALGLACAAALVGLAALGCAGGPPEPPPSVPPPTPPPPPRDAGTPRNFLVIVADDLGTDKVSAYGESPDPPHTARIDALAAEGVLFRNAYTYPTCSASRAALLTGRYGRRNGMGGIVELDQSEHELPLNEVLVPEALERQGASWSAGAIGKWHLSGFETPSAFRHPLLQGFDRARGALGNLVLTAEPGLKGDYFQYQKNVDGVPRWSTAYATTETTDDAIAALRELPEPFFLWVAYNAVHEPFHWPPDHPGAPGPGGRGSAGQPPGARGPQADGRRPARPGAGRPDPVQPRIAMHTAMVESLDRQVGRLLDAMTEEQRASTTVVFVGDNGTDGPVITPPFDPRRGKGTLYEGGTNVPLIVAGAGVEGQGESQALVHAVDLMPTILELAGVTAEGLVLDGVSFAPQLADPAAPGAREVVYTERFAPIGAGPYDADRVAVRDRRYKLVRGRSGDWQLFDLKGHHDDGRMLRLDALDPEQQRRLDALRAELARIERTVRYEY